MNGLFVTGCGTDIGKTIVTTAFLLSAKRLGLNATVFKPVQTGCSATIDAAGNSTLGLPDLDSIAEICCTSEAEAKELKSHYTYAYLPACSPHLAASMAGNEEISLDKIFHTAKELEKEYDLVIIEGAGGIMVPLNENDTFRDLAQMLKYETVVVASNKLGCINDTLLTIEALTSKELFPLGIIMNTTSEPQKEDDYIRKNNPEIIERYSGVPVVTEVPHTPDTSKENTIFWDTLARKLEPILKHVTKIERV